VRQPKNLLKLAGLVALMGAPAVAQEAARVPDAEPAPATGTTFRFEAKVGAEYNSNVAVIDIDANTGESDWAATINALAEVTVVPVDKLTLRAGYDFSQSLHDEFDAFDLAIHRGYGEVAYDFDLVTVGVLGNLAQANLDGDEYLTLRQVQPYLSKQFGNSLFLRAAYSSTDKEFEGRPQRDATADAVQIDGYFFLDGVQRYVVLGGRATEEDANAAEFDFSSWMGRARFVQRFEAFGQNLAFRAGVEYEDRDYDNVTPLIGAPRSDKRTTADAQIDIPLGDTFFSEISYRYGRYESNLASADYDEHVGAVKLGVKY
jgi:hypothetical protein